MDRRIGAKFPGGPGRIGTPPDQGRHARLESIAEIEARVARRRLARSRTRRTRRIALGFALATIVAAGVGFSLGLRSGRTAEELTQAQEATRRQDIDVSSEVNRTLLELWKMEDFESFRDAGRTR